MNLVAADGKYYLVDLSAFHRSMLEPMPMVMPPPPPEPGFRIYMDYSPKMMIPQVAFLMCDDSFGPDPVWEFKFLFPLGKRAYVTRK